MRCLISKRIHLAEAVRADGKGIVLVLLLLLLLEAYFCLEVLSLFLYCECLGIELSSFLYYGRHIRDWSDSLPPLWKRSFCWYVQSASHFVLDRLSQRLSSFDEVFWVSVLILPSPGTSVPFCDSICLQHTSFFLERRLGSPIDLFISWSVPLIYLR